VILYKQTSELTYNVHEGKYMINKPINIFVISNIQLSPFLIIFWILQVALAELCAKSERYIGTEGGGMDQSISFLAERGTVCRFPFSTSRSGSFVIRKVPYINSNLNA